MLCNLILIDDIIEQIEFSLARVAYFSYNGAIFCQKFGMAMGSPLSPIGCNIFMEWLENKAITTAPITCRPRFWRRYVDDVLEIVRKGEVDNLTEHLKLTLRTVSSLHMKKNRTESSHFLTLLL